MTGPSLFKRERESQVHLWKPKDERSKKMNRRSKSDRVEELSISLTVQVRWRWCHVRFAVTAFAVFLLIRLVFCLSKIKTHPVIQFIKMTKRFTHTELILPTIQKRFCTKFVRCCTVDFVDSHYIMYMITRKRIASMMKVLIITFHPLNLRWLTLQTENCFINNLDN